MFYIRLTYFKVILDWISDLAEWHKIHRITQYKCKLHLAKCICSNCHAQFNHNTNVIPITGLCNMLTIMMLGIPTCQESICRLKAAQVHCSLENSFISCSGLILYVGLSQVFTLPHSGLANSGRHSHSSINLGEEHLYHQLIHSTVDCSLPKIKATLCSPWCWGKSSSLQQLRLVKHYIIPWASWAHLLAHLLWPFFHCRALLVSHN